MVHHSIIVAALSFIVLGVLILLSLPKPNILVSADIRTETIETVVYNPSEAEFTLPRARLLYSDEAPCLEDVLVRPGQGAIVVYTMELSEDWFAVVDGEVSWREATGAISQSSDGVAFMLSADDEHCSASGRLRLPVAGSLSVGLLVAGNQEGGDGLLPILEGTLTVYGRAIEQILWGVPLTIFERVLPLEPGRLYYADKFVIPSGSRMETKEARWWGFVDVDLLPGMSSMWLHASTNASSVALFAPAPKRSKVVTGQSAFEADEVSLTLAARISNDPNLRWLFAIASFLLVVIGLVSQALSLRRE